MVTLALGFSIGTAFANEEGHVPLAFRVRPLEFISASLTRSSPFSRHSRQLAMSVLCHSVSVNPGHKCSLR